MKSKFNIRSSQVNLVYFYLHQHEEWRADINQAPASHNVETTIRNIKKSYCHSLRWSACPGASSSHGPAPPTTVAPGSSGLSAHVSRKWSCGLSGLSSSLYLFRKKDAADPHTDAWWVTRMRSLLFPRHPSTRNRDNDSMETLEPRNFTTDQLFKTVMTAFMQLCVCLWMFMSMCVYF